MPQEQYGPFYYEQPILKSVDNRAIYDFTRKHEGAVRYLYKDKEDNITAGIGQIVPDIRRARSMTFEIMEDRNKPLRRATNQEIERAFEKVRTAPKGMDVKRYDPFEHPDKFDKLYMPEAVIERRMDKDLRRSARELHAQMPRFDDIHPSARKALLDLQFNMGLTRFNARKWPKLFGAIDAQDWEKAAAESNRIQVSPERNKEIYDLFMDSKDRKEDRRGK